MINFGTDGWRAIISKDFTIENLERVAVGIAKLIKSEARKNLEIYNIDYNRYPFASYKVQYRDYKSGVVVGYDHRFMSEYYAQKVAEVLTSFDIPVLLSNTPCSTPALSLKVFKNHAAGIMITASHNPYFYNGVKYKAEYGGSATNEMTKMIENFLKEHSNSIIPKKEIIDASISLQQEYLETIKSKIDIEKIKKFIEKNNILIVVDYMFGVLSNSFKSIINSKNIIEINNNRNPYFNGGSPEPIPQNLRDLQNITRMLGENAIGFAFDGDGDRIFAINYKEWISPHEILPLLAIHLVKNKKWHGKLIRTLPTSTKLKRLADKMGLEAIETPVGFKYIADLFVKDNILIGGEESGGIGFKNHIPERDSLLNALYIIEMLSDMNIKPIEILDYLHSFTGISYCYRKDSHFNSIEEQRENYQKFINNIEKIRNLINGTIEIRDYIKIVEDDKNWIVLRPSGTEPLIRIYSEANTLDQAEEKVNKILQFLQDK
ncbi:MAG: phosphoglucomutase/phosphomannomutase family protein [Candidatus Calescibacterium sp.]|nr:phosphoglucomutase/phosphomannomutase family protein [Candidatus Calescibacterium sp.]MDW8132398.1 phosphoglucomutase/phosphomannomutase family protein [Candidatus Calescibacterium sp.]